MKESYISARFAVRLIVLFAFTTALHADDKADKILQTASNKLESVKQLCADYVQTFNWQLAQETHTTVGKIYIRDGVSFRIETPEQLIITDGKTLWTVSHANEQVIVDAAENNTRDNPFLRGFIRNTLVAYDAKLVGEEEGAWYLLLTARSEDEFQREIHLWIDRKTDLIRKVTQVDINGNTVTYELTQIDTRVELNNDHFRGEVPEGYEVIDMREMQ
ncbi:outer membrane lipoprotein carrier protein LolA [candidate division KSB1 bacterium]|nr:outer membrane lipoprotein carrier protein LolA [candidate division KSB1 bacterium]